MDPPWKWIRETSSWSNSLTFSVFPSINQWKPSYKPKVFPEDRTNERRLYSIHRRVHALFPSEIRIVNMLVHNLALCLINLWRISPGQSIQNLFYTETHSCPRLLALAPIENKLAI